MKIPELNSDDYLKKDENFWRDYRKILSSEVKKDNNKKKIEKTPQNIYKLAKEIGIKPAARSFNIEPATVRYYIKKIESNNK